MTAGFVYCIEDTQGHVKIGYAKRLVERVSKVEPSTPIPCSLRMTYWHSHARKIEPIVHKILHDARVNGEWFKCSIERIKNAIVMACTIIDRKTASPKTEDSHVFVEGWGEQSETTEEFQVRVLCDLFGHGNKILGRKRLSKLCNVGKSTISMWKTLGMSVATRAVIYKYLVEIGVPPPAWLLGDIDTPGSMEELDDLPTPGVPMKQAA